MDPHGPELDTGSTARAHVSGVREHKKARTRSSILRAGGELFRQHGFDETSVDEIARASSVSRQTFFNYF